MSDEIDAIINRIQAQLAQMDVTNDRGQRLDGEKPDLYDELLLVKAALESFKRPRPTPSLAGDASNWFDFLKDIERIGSEVWFHSYKLELHTLDRTGGAGTPVQLGDRQSIIAMLRVQRRRALGVLRDMGYDLSDVKSDWDKEPLS